MTLNPHTHTHTQLNIHFLSLLEAKVSKVQAGRQENDTGGITLRCTDHAVLNKTDGNMHPLPQVGAAIIYCKRYSITSESSGEYN